MVGSGKSTAARHVVSVLARKGLAPELRGLQSLSWFGSAGKRAGPTVERPRPARGSRGSGYRRKRLTVWRTLAYAGRLLAFRVFHLRRRSRVIVLNRYFYDSFVHYNLATSTERLMAALLARLIPRPDVAIVLVASLDTIVARRPSYSPEYLASLHEGYCTLEQRFPNLVRVRTDGPKSAAIAAIDDVLFRAGAQRAAVDDRV
jgi:hypothetical protein